MLTPILRLVLIYLVLILAVVGVFNRDKLARLVSGDPPEAAAPERGVPTPLVSAPPAAPIASQPVVPQAVPAATPTPQAQPAAPGQATALQTPVAPPQNQSGGAPAAQGMAPAPTLQAEAMQNPALAEAVNAARSAYWSGDFAGAEAQLVALTESHPDIADLFGELGNFRFSQRDYPGAAAAYLRAGELLADQGRSGQAMSLLPVLQQIDPDKAATLATRLQIR